MKIFSRTSKAGKKGFTLAELLIVVAIIGVLLAILIPTFTASLKKAQLTTDAANVRSYYSEQVIISLDDDNTATPSFTANSFKAVVKHKSTVKYVPPTGTADPNKGTITVSLNGTDSKSFSVDAKLMSSEKSWTITGD